MKRSDAWRRGRGRAVSDPIIRLFERRGRPFWRSIWWWGSFVWFSWCYLALGNVS
jgi:hypothetical protein